MVVLGGGMQPVHKLHGTMQVAAYTVPSRWAFESMILLEVDHQTKWKPPSLRPGQPTPPGLPTTHQDVAEYHFPTDEEGKSHRGAVWHGVMALAILFTILVASIFVILRFRDVH